MKFSKYILSFALASTLAGVTTSCQDMLDKGNEYVIYTDGRELTTPEDTVTNMLGILTKMQAIGVRTNLLGEVRADLVQVNDNAINDLKKLADFDADVYSDEESNRYNLPRDYYAIINNCNYYLSVADSTAGNTNRNEKYFVNEIAQVHSIRAWVYLQAVLAYGKVPFITEPVLTKIQSDAKYPMYDLDAICDYFISDLQPYYGHEYPDPRDFGGSVKPNICFYPSQIVMGDLYLYKAVSNHDKEMAKKAAKAYYDYIMWDKSGKKILQMNRQTASWSERSLYEKRYKSPSGGFDYEQGSTWGTANAEGISVIAMDSASTSGYYNELRNLYNYTNKTDVSEASISPTQILFDLSEAQRYFGYDTQRNVVEVTRDQFEEEEIQKHLLGDLRLQAYYSKRKVNLNSKDYNQQTIDKHRGQHVAIYRQTQLYLRLAEALNYAGYPRFAKTFLTIGPNNTVIQNEVLPYYTSAADSAFIKYFDFNTNTFISPVESYSLVRDSLDIITKYDRVFTAQTNQATMAAIHDRGSGLTYLNQEYMANCAPDSTGYPFQLASQVGHKPVTADYDYPTAPSKPKTVVEPSTWGAYPNQLLTKEEYEAYHGKSITDKVYTRYNDSIANYSKYVNETMPAYEADLATYNEEVALLDAEYAADLAAYNERHDVFQQAYDSWYTAAYSDASLISKEQETVDQQILDEQALELSFEGNRFYDLMRRALWYNDVNRLAEPIGKRNPALQGKLQNKSNWYLHYKGQIGY